MNVLNITIESDFTLCWSKCCGYYKYRYATSSPTRLARTKIITKKDRWLEASRCSKPRPTLALSTCIHHTAEFWALHPNHQVAAKGRGRSLSLSFCDWLVLLKYSFWAKTDKLCQMKHSTSTLYTILVLRITPKIRHSGLKFCEFDFEIALANRIFSFL